MEAVAKNSDARVRNEIGSKITDPNIGERGARAGERKRAESRTVRVNCKESVSGNRGAVTDDGSVVYPRVGVGKVVSKDDGVPKTRVTHNSGGDGAAVGSNTDNGIPGRIDVAEGAPDGVEGTALGGVAGAVRGRGGHADGSGRSSRCNGGTGGDGKGESATEDTRVSGDAVPLTEEVPIRGDRDGAVVPDGRRPRDTGDVGTGVDGDGAPGSSEGRAPGTGSGDGDSESRCDGVDVSEDGVEPHSYNPSSRNRHV